MYKHTQIGWVVLASLIAGMLLMGFITVYMANSQIGDKHSIWANAVGLGLLAIATLLFYNLTVVVDNRSVKASFGLGVIRKSIPLEDIESCRAVRNRWWYGWGIHWTTKGCLYNVSGMMAVELRLKNGKRIRIGTDRPGELEVFINDKLANHPENEV
jgi:hypothetical protein